MIWRKNQPGLTCALVQQGSLKELHLTLHLLPEESMSSAFGRLEAVLREHEATIVRQEVFGSIHACKETMTVMRSVLRKPSWPVTWVEAIPCGRGRVAGMHFLAVAGAEVHHLTFDAGWRGAVYDQGETRHCFIGGLFPKDLSASRQAQAGQLYEQLEAALVQSGMNLSHLVRTWFFLEDILRWYGEFNEIRNEVYIQRRLLENLVPASTGIGATNPAGSALLASAWAIRSKDSSLSSKAIASPLQCSAPSYGSCFNRAVELATSDARQLLISGTASIDPQGRSARRDDFAGQVDLTMRVIEAILRAQQMSFADATRATAYLKHASDVSEFYEYLAARGLDRMPLVVACADVCRDELLFEMELDAIQPSVDARPSGAVGR
jgi:enamine deaminase RidA (YjgF/YER057c/UK114 family)